MKKKYSIIAGTMIASLSFQSCATTNAYTGEQQVSKTLKGGAIGAAAGALIGSLAGDSKDALKGAAIGGILGGGVGAYMDTQEAEIRRQLSGSGVSVTRAGNDLILNMPSDITFSSGSASIQSQFSSTLSSVGIVLKKYNKTAISVEGHTDSDGSASSNQSLSVARANSVAGVLSANGVANNRLLVSGAGESRPIASNDTAAGKSQNRRVELRIEPQQAQF